MADNAKPVTLTDATFKSEVLDSGIPVLIDFWATWCGPCRMIAPVIEQLADEFDGRAKIGKLDVDRNPETAMQFGVRSIPTLLFVKDGHVVDQVIGAVSKKILTDKLEGLVSLPANS
jgi:thioredoxin 1